jgi:hypothetical protein
LIDWYIFLKEHFKEFLKSKVNSLFLEAT